MKDEAVILRWFRAAKLEFFNLFVLMKLLLQALPFKRLTRKAFIF
ncbi:hypothetical protein CHISP_2538 [Chitinispirillum alkaliphilum]|nr:hypothetical protein CHISP_2538 [Chitinispirillum alkaliphilum]